MNCLYCGKPILETASTAERRAGWHSKCVKKFFGAKEMPIIDISEESLKELAAESVNKGYTVTGVQKKLSLHLSLDEHPRLTLVNYPTGYILKPQVDEFERLPESEYLIMEMADITGIKTVPHALINIHGDIAYITKRIDRFDTKGKPVVLAMEDFCQLEERLTQDKYKGSYERCAKVIQKYSHSDGLDMSEFFLRIVFSFAVGNSDMHLKNFSLIETAEGGNQHQLSAAYDLVPVNVIMPEDNEEFALTLNGKKKNIKRKDFLEFAATCGLSAKIAENLIAKTVSLQETYCNLCDASLLSPTLKESLKSLIRERLNRLSLKN
ncbi:MAG: HipA domain-containing protein [Clostridia bacterium]